MLSCFSCVPLFVTPWTVACQASLSVGILQARILEWAAISSSEGSSQGSTLPWQVGYLPLVSPGKPKIHITY